MKYSFLKESLNKSVIILLLLGGLFSCKKEIEKASPTVNPIEQVVAVADPETARTVGFFLDNWQAKAFTTPAFVDVAPPAATNVSTVTVDASKIIAKIPTSIFAHNANTWMTSMVDQPTLLTHLTNLHPNIIRFPAGSGSDLYFWNQPKGVLPPDVPAKLMDKDGVMQDASYWFGKTTENWTASLDNYYETLQKTGNKGMLTVNYGYARYGTSTNPVAAAAHLAADWVRYDKGRTQYWEIGNETYGDWEAGYRIDVSKNKDGQPQYVTGKLYAQHFKVFADSMRKAAAETGKPIYIGATLYESPSESWQTNTVKTWNSTVLPELAGKNDFYIVHNYFTPYNQNSNAATVLGAAASVPKTMMDFLNNQIQTNQGTPKPIALTEWNMWALGSKQQVSNTSGLFAVIVQGEAIANQYGFTARWDLLNGWANGDDHGLFSDGNEPGIPKWTPRPSFYYMYYFQKTIGDRLVPTTTTNANLKTYASTFSSGETAVTLVNTSAAPITIELKFRNFNPGYRYYWYTLEGGSDNGEFSRKVVVNGSGTNLAAGGPADYATLKARSALVSQGVKVTVPALGAAFVQVEKR